MANRIPVPFASEKVRRLNQNKPCHGEPCLLCDAEIKNPAAAVHVHMTTSLELVPADEELTEEQGSQGCFPVGPECAKKVPRRFWLKW